MIGILEINKVYNIDCLAGMKKIDNKSINSIICDLPYGMTANKQDAIIPFKPLWRQYERIIKDNGAIILFGQGSFFAKLVLSNEKMFRYEIIWNKILTSGFLNANRMPLRQHELIAVFYKHLPTYNPQFTEGKPLHSKGYSYKNKEIQDRNYGKYESLNDNRKGSTQKYPTSIINYQKPHPSVCVHRTEKSIEMLRYIIRTYTNEDDLILDNACGSGTTLIAAKLENRNYIGMDNGYFDGNNSMFSGRSWADISRERLEKY